uniref:Uncharacterized protein n=1 Tax=Vespula pensylvanica TaxID=30213 RepID=A0A834PF62_VESPE|nr:hypothetical protein H0235_001079 [Vespula pensylvanica]
MSELLYQIRRKHEDIFGGDSFEWILWLSIGQEPSRLVTGLRNARDVQRECGNRVLPSSTYTPTCELRSSSENEFERYLDKTAINFIPLPNGIIILQFNNKVKKLNIIKAYAPTMEKDLAKISDFCKELEELYNPMKEENINLIMGI